MQNRHNTLDIFITVCYPFVTIRTYYILERKQKLKSNHNILRQKQAKPIGFIQFEVVTFWIKCYIYDLF